jgi:glycosidase
MPSSTSQSRGWSIIGVVLLAALFGACGGCDPQDGGPDGGRVEDGGPDGSVDACDVAFAFRPLSSATSVHVIGEWNGFDRQAHPMAGPDASGVWTATVLAPKGSWAYAFLVNGAEQLDPGNDATREVEGRTYSLLENLCVPVKSESIELRVKEGSVEVSRSEAGKGSFVAVVEIARSADAVGTLRLEGTVREPGDHVDADWWPRALSAAELSLSQDQTQASISLQGLADGKYTVKLRALLDNCEADILLPFWIEPEPFSFYDSPLYMLMTDRFRDGEPGNNPERGYGVSLSADFQGGDLQGVEQAIREGYFDRLGIRAIWLTPWQTQPAGSFPDQSGQHQVKGYHGYWPIKAREVDPRLGGAEALHSMVEEAHRHGIRIIMDAVVNHVHEEHEYYTDPDKAHWFRTDCICGSPGCDWDEKRLSCLFTGYMPDINWNVKAAAAQFVADILWWIEEFDLDGLRVDAVKHVEDNAMVELATAVRKRFETAGTDYYMFGETFSDDYGLLNYYIGPDKLDGQLDFPRFMKVPEPVFALLEHDQGKVGFQHAKYWTEESIRQFGDAMMVTFVGNHDVARFITKADPANRDRQGSKWENLPGPPAGQEPYDRLWLAMLHLMTTPGVPLVYYGDEYGEFGGSDPDNRHFMNQEATLWPEQRNQLERMQRLLKGREKLRGLARGPLLHMWCNDDWEGKGNLYAYARLDSEPRESAVVVLNLTQGTWGEVVVNFPQELGWSSGTVYDVVSGHEWTFANGSVTLDVPGQSGVVLGLR